MSVLSNTKRTFFLFILLLTLPVQVASAQVLPSFETDKTIRKGTLPNGADYFLVDNKEARGYADFALVQKNHVDGRASRRMLAYLQDFGFEKPYRYLAAKGVGYSKNGFVSIREGSTVFSFRNVPVYDGAAPDSTLLILFDIMKETDASQAIIVSGDMDLQKISDRIYAMSMTVPRLSTSTPDTKYTWKPQKYTGIRTIRSNSGNVVSVAASFRSPRTPDNLMNTPQPLVTRMFTEELGTIVASRLKAAFREENVPLAACDFTGTDSGHTGKDERYSFRVFTGKERTMDATRILAKVLGDLCIHGAQPDEFANAREKLIWSASNYTGVPTNEYYVDKCIRSWLFNAPLVPGKTERAFLANHQLPVEQELKLFNDFTAALLGSPAAANLTYAVPGTSLDTDAHIENFTASWVESLSDTTRYGYRACGSDTLRLHKPKAKVKLKSSATDPVTGGSIWTFSNGMKVVFKKSSEIDGFEYALMIRGGYSSVPGLKAGENAFVSDMLYLFNVAGMPAYDFSSMLSDNGISMKRTVSAADMRISGSAPSSKLTLLMKSLLAFASDRKVDRRAFESYRIDEAVRVEGSKYSPEGLSMLRDSLMFPSYKFISAKRMGNLKDDLPERTEKYLATQFAKTSDGILTIVGNLDATAVQKILTQYLGGFRTSKSSTIRPKIPFTLRPGWITYSLNRKAAATVGDKCGIYSVSTSLPFNMETYMSFKIAAVAMEKAAVKSLADCGYYAEATANASMFPTDRFSVTIEFRPCAERGLPAKVKPTTPNVALDAVRQGMLKVTEEGVSTAELKACKTELKSRLASELSSPSRLCTASVTRYSLGRDLISRYAEYVDAVSTESVKNVLKALDGGSKVEIISR